MGGQPRGGHGVKLRRGCLLLSSKQETSYLLTTFAVHQIAAGSCRDNLRPGFILDAKINIHASKITVISGGSRRPDIEGADTRL